jgi:hypothetical protein
MFCHTLEPVDPCFEDGHKSFLSDLVANGWSRDLSRAGQGCHIRWISFDITNEKEVTWCEVRAVSRVRSPLDPFWVKPFSGSPCIRGHVLSRWVVNPLSDFLRECKGIPSNKLGMTVSQKNAELYMVPFGTSSRLWIPLTDQRSEIRHFSVLISWFTLSGTSSHDNVRMLNPLTPFVSGASLSRENDPTHLIFSKLWSKTLPKSPKPPVKCEGVRRGLSVARKSK